MLHAPRTSDKITTYYYKYYIYLSLPCVSGHTIFFLSLCRIICEMGKNYVWGHFWRGLDQSAYYLAVYEGRIWVFLLYLLYVSHSESLVNNPENICLLSRVSCHSLLAACHKIFTSAYPFFIFPWDHQLPFSSLSHRFPISHVQNSTRPPSPFK